MSAQTSPPAGGSSPPVLALFAKVPRPGEVKTRLCPPLSPDEAAALYGAFLRRVAVPHPGARTVVYGAPPEGFVDLAAWIHPDLELRPQQGATLWQRLQHCVDEVLAEGVPAVVVRSTDSPDVPPARLDEALAACAPGRVVLGPDPGGGFWLVGVAGPCDGLFEVGDCPPEQACAAVAANAVALGLQVVRLGVERDVDTYDDLLALWAARATGR